MANRPASLTVLTAGTLALAVAGCAGETADPAELLAEATTVLADTTSAHFVLTSEGVPEGGAALLGGEGDVVRPDGFAGDLDVALAGASASVEVISVDGVLYAQLPFASGFTETDPALIGIADPGAFLAPDGGVTRLLAEASNPVAEGEERLGETVVQRVAVELPPDVVADVLAAADGADPFEAVLAIDPETAQLRSAAITGEFLGPDVESTYTIELSDYDEPIEISAPTG